jgi:hypothetical protein
MIDGRTVTMQGEISEAQKAERLLFLCPSTGLSHSAWY